MGLLRWFAAWFGACVVLFIRATCRQRVHNDPRPALRAQGRSYAYASLHGHQLGCVIVSERGSAAMVSRSRDGDLLVPSLVATGIVPVRGSTRKRGKNKGGSEALQKLVDLVSDGTPAYLAVDGPRGPRGHVNRGIARLCVETGAAALLTLPLPARRWILTKAWDRMQIPKPFTRIDLHFDVIEPLPGEEVETMRQRIELGLAELEKRHDPEEAALGEIAAESRRQRLVKEKQEAASGTDDV